MKNEEGHGLCQTAVDLIREVLDETIRSLKLRCLDHQDAAMAREEFESILCTVKYRQPQAVREQPSAQAADPTNFGPGASLGRHVGCPQERPTSSTDCTCGLDEYQRAQRSQFCGPELRAEQRKCCPDCDHDEHRINWRCQGCGAMGAPAIGQPSAQASGEARQPYADSLTELGSSESRVDQPTPRCEKCGKKLCTGSKPGAVWPCETCCQPGSCYFCSGGVGGDNTCLRCGRDQERADYPADVPAVAQAESEADECFECGETSPHRGCEVCGKGAVAVLVVGEDVDVSQRIDEIAEAGDRILVGKGDRGYPQRPAALIAAQSQPAPPASCGHAELLREAVTGLRVLETILATERLSLGQQRAQEMIADIQAALSEADAGEWRLVGAEECIGERPVAWRIIVDGRVDREASQDSFIRVGDRRFYYRRAGKGAR